MAYTKTPTGDTYQSKDVPLVYKWDQRGSTIISTLDSQTINAVPEVVKDPIGGSFYNAYKRDGCTHISWRNFIPPQPQHDDWSLPVVGIHTNTAANEVVVITQNGVSSGVVYVGLLGASTPSYTLEVPFITANPILTSNVNGQFNFTDFVYDNGDIVTMYGVKGNGTLGRIKHTTGYAVTTVATSATNGDPVALDGYIFASAPDGSIYNSNLNDPMTWNASNFIVAESYGDKLIRIARCGSYILAFGTNSVEWYYDAANPTGSPLSVYQGATRRVGYIGGLAYAGDDLYFVGKDEDGAMALYKASGLKLEKIVDFSISRQVFKGSTNNPFFGSFITLNGHTLYVLSSINGPVDTTMFYDLETQFFGNLTFKTGDVFYLKQVASLRVNGTNGSEYVNMFCGTMSVLEDSYRVYAFSPWFYQDDGSNFTVTLRTPNHDFDTRRNKFGSRVLIHADRPTGSSPPNNPCTLAWSTNDYGGGQPEFSRTINLNDEYPATFALGQFRRIAFTLTYTGPSAIRFKMLEFDYNVGGQ